MIVRCVESHVEQMIWGTPGVGKTRRIEAVSRRLSMIRGTSAEDHTLICSMCEPSDLSGFPIADGKYRRKDGTDLSVVQFAPREAFVRLATHGGVLFFDELSTAPPSIQAVALRIINDRVAGDIHLPPDKVAMIAAGNPPETGAGVFDLSAPMANRLCHLMWPTDSQFRRSWAEDFISYWGNPPRVEFNGRAVPEEFYSRARRAVAAFIMSSPENLLPVPNSGTAGHGTVADLAYPTPRSWDAAARVLASGESRLFDKENGPVMLSLISGLVGTGPAQAFSKFIRDSDLPDPMKLLDNPESYRPQKEDFVAYATITAVVSTVLSLLVNKREEIRSSKSTDVLYRQAVKYIQAAAKIVVAAGEGRPETAKGPLDRLLGAARDVHMTQAEQEALSRITSSYSRDMRRYKDMAIGSVTLTSK